IVIIGASLSALEATSATLCLALTRLIDSDRAVAQRCAVQLCDRGLCFLVVAHVNKTEAFAAAAITISDNSGGSYFSNLSEKINKILFGGLIGESPNIKSHILICSCDDISKHIDARRN